jgi:hypothetical protein
VVLGNVIAWVIGGVGMIEMRGAVERNSMDALPLISPSTQLETLLQADFHPGNHPLKI